MGQQVNLVLDEYNKIHEIPFFIFMSTSIKFVLFVMRQPSVKIPNPAPLLN